MSQKMVAIGMKRRCATSGCDLAIMLGDNFYDSGVYSVFDDKFEDYFEEPYASLDIPFYAALGNHDTRGNVQAQIDYMRRSEYWKMPLVVSGAAAKIRNTSSGRRSLFARSQHGFVRLVFEESTMSVNYYNLTGHEIFQKTIK